MEKLEALIKELEQEYNECINPFSFESDSYYQRCRIVAAYIKDILPKLYDIKKTLEEEKSDENNI